MPGARSDEARAFLESVREARFNMDRASRELQQAEALCTQITAQISGAPGGSGDAHKDGAWAALADHRTLLRQLYEDAERQAVAVEQFVKLIPADKHRIILRLRYIDLLTWPEVQKRMEKSNIYYSERQLYRIHGNALQAARRLWAELHPEEGENQ